MKKISLLVLLILSINAYSQIEHSIRLLIEGFKKFPEEAFNDTYGSLSTKDRIDIINYYNSINQKDSAVDLIKFDGFHGDVGVYYELKGFVSNGKFIIGYTNKLSTSSTKECGNIYFFEYSNSELTDITSVVLGSFNYYTDNYSKSTNRRISEKYGYNVENNPSNKHLLYSFTPSDTLYISESFFGIEEDIGLDTTYFDGEFYTKKYIMENGKLRLVEWKLLG